MRDWMKALMAGFVVALAIIALVEASIGNSGLGICVMMWACTSRIVDQ